VINARSLRLDLKKAQTVMGHSSIQATFDIYGHPWKETEEELKAMAQIKARLLA